MIRKRIDFLNKSLNFYFWRKECSQLWFG